MERPNRLIFTKQPSLDVNTMGMHFNNLFYVDTALPEMFADSSLNGQTRFEHFYLFESAFKVKYPLDATKVFMNSTYGFLGFETLSGDL